MKNATTNQGSTDITTRDAYAVGREVTRGNLRQEDREVVANLMADHGRTAAYYLGRDRFARTGEH